jgi:phosphatidate phosphatase APP1
MAAIRKALRRVAIDLDRQWDRLKLDLLRRLGGPGPLRIEAYRGLGRPDRLLLKGRVLVDRGPTVSEDDDDFWDDLGNMYRRLHTTEIPGARVRISAAGASSEAVTDEEGFFELELRAAGEPFSAPRQSIELELVDPDNDPPVQVQGEAVVRSPDAGFLVISDIDDTVVRTQATHALAMARATFLGSARSRVPFPGVAALYTALVEGRTGDEGNPLVFVSRSPWNLYDLFDEFCTLQGIPAGRVLYLRDWGLSAEGLSRARPRGHKFRLISRLLEFEPDLPVILIGDSGQKDPEIYSEIVEEHPGRILAAFIRNVSHSERRAAVIDDLAAQVKVDGGALHLIQDSLEVARLAAELGWIRDEAVAAVAAEFELDQRAPTPLEELIEDPPRSVSEASGHEPPNR